MIELQVSLDPWLNSLEAARGQLPFVLSTAVNAVTKEAQAAVQERVAEVFTIRAPGFINRTVKITKFSDKAEREPTAQLAIQNPEGDTRQPVLARFESGMPKVALSEDLPVVIPSLTARPAFGDLVPRSLYPVNLGLVPRHGVTGIVPVKRHVTARGVVQLQGKQRTFVLNAATMFGVRQTAIFQRIGPGRHDIQMLWMEKQRVQVDRRLRFHETVTQTVAQRWSAIATEKLFNALATAK